MKRFVGEFEFYEKTPEGGFDSAPHCYIKDGDTEDEVKNYADVIWQAIEIEGMDDTEICVNARFTNNGEYLDGDEFFIRTKIVRTKEPSRFVKWGDKKPHIFAVDRKKSKIELID